MENLPSAAVCSRRRFFLPVSDLHTKFLLQVLFTDDS